MQLSYETTVKKTARKGCFFLERVRGIEPRPPAWKARVLPLYDTRASYLAPGLRNLPLGKLPAAFRGYSFQFHA
jgi:hypothetical protein